MSGQDQTQRGKSKSDADQTLLGVAPPRVDTSTESPQRSPVFVRAGTSSADTEPAPLPRMALPSRPPRGADSASDAALGNGPAGEALAQGQLATALRYARSHPAVSMVLIPALFSLCVIALVGHRAKHGRRAAVTSNAVISEPAAGAAIEPPKAETLAELERRPPSSLSSREVVILAAGRAEQKRSLVGALRQKIEQNPALGKDNAVLSQLLHLAEDPTTATDAVSAMALLEPPSGADLLYEVWTATQIRTDTTELARALLYSTDVRPKASPALAVALELRVAETCQQYQVILPKALTDGDRRAWHLLTKLTAKRGCGPKKSDDCFECLRAKSDELSATINAVKSRRAPIFAAQ